MNKLIFVFILLSSNFFCLAQDNWTLSSCIERAVNQNIDIKRQRLSTKLAIDNLQQSKFALFPSLNAYGSQGYNFGRAIDPLTNEFTLENVKSNNFSISSTVTVFNGFKKLNVIRRNQLEVSSAEENTRKVINDISLTVANSFLQVLFSKEIVQVAKQQLSLSSLQVQRVSKMVDAGSLAKGNLLEVESQMIAEELELVNAENQLAAAYLNIKQLLEIEDGMGFNVTAPELLLADELNLPSAAEIYKQYEILSPDIKAAVYRLESTKKSHLISKAELSPQISVNTSIGTGYSDSRYNLITSNPISFSTQIEDNLSQSVTISLSIPILNSWQVQNGITQAKISVEDASYQLQQVRNQLRKEIEQARSDVLAAKKQYQFAKKSNEALLESFRYAEKKYNIGLVNIYEFNEVKNRWNRAQSDYIRAKYDYLFKMKIIDFYLGKNLIL